MMNMKIMAISSGTDNDKAMKYVKDNYNLGPEVTSIKPNDNKEYWIKMSKTWKVSEPEARRRLCANCEYYNNTPESMEEMENISLNKYDLDGGGRGYCHEFDFICHNLRTCENWEKKEFINEDMKSEPKGLGKMHMMPNGEMMADKDMMKPNIKKNMKNNMMEEM